MSSAAPVLLFDRPKLIKEGSLVVAVDERSSFPDAATLKRVRRGILKNVGLSEGNLRQLTPNEIARSPLRVLFQADGAGHVTTDQADEACEIATNLMRGSSPAGRTKRKPRYRNRRYWIGKRKGGTDH